MACGVGVFVTESVYIHVYTQHRWSHEYDDKYGRASDSCAAVTIDLSYELVTVRSCSPCRGERGMERGLETEREKAAFQN